TKLPSGLLGLVLASLGAAYMSTISTHLNWGSSYVVNDFYRQQIRKKANEKELVMVGRITTVVLMIASAIFALYLTNAKQLFDIIIMFGAGTGLIFILRWFWWRINAWSEIVAMFSSGIISLLFWRYEQVLFLDETAIFPLWSRFPLVVLITSVLWITVTFLTPAEKTSTLIRFYKITQPGGPGWKKIVDQASSQGVELTKGEGKWTVPSGILAMLVGCVFVYSCMFATGNWIYGNYGLAMGLTIAVIASAFLLKRIWDRIKDDLL
ncbi:MAG: Na+:solute symporter, partial [Flavobacteriaceae bacterium]